MATLLSFAPPSREGWSNDERAQFARIQHLLADAGAYVEIEHGVTDEGDPWCVFCSEATGEVIIHVAFLDGQYFFDSAILPDPIRGRSFNDCAQQFIDDTSLPARSQKSPKIMIHPSAMLAGMILTIFLALEMITEPAFAATADRDTEAKSAPDGDRSENTAIAEKTSEEDDSPLLVAVKQALLPVTEAIQKSESDRSGVPGTVTAANWMSLMPNAAVMVAIAFSTEAYFLTALKEVAAPSADTGDRPEEFAGDIAIEAEYEATANQITFTSEGTAAATGAVHVEIENIQPEIVVTVEAAGLLQSTAADAIAIQPGDTAAPAADRFEFAPALSVQSEEAASEQAVRQSSSEALPASDARLTADFSSASQLIELFSQVGPDAERFTVNTVAEALSFAGPADALVFADAPAAPAIEGNAGQLPAVTEIPDNTYHLSFTDLLSAFVAVTGTVETLIDDGNVIVYDNSIFGYIDDHDLIGVHTETLRDNSEIVFVGFVAELDLIFT